MRPSPPRRKARSVLQGLQQALRLPFAAAFFCLIASAATADTRSEGAALVSAVVRLSAEIPPDARTAAGLGTQRDGNGVVIDDSGLILTIGYLILEAMTVTAFTADGKPVPADILAYDYDTGFGLVRALSPLNVKPIAIGDSDTVNERDPIIVAGHGGVDSAIGAMVVSRREFAGYWEYLLDNAIFTSPPHPNWGGTALINLDGELVGIGSLIVNDALPATRPIPGNMFVPINLLKPVFADLLESGRAGGPQRPWLGIFTAEQAGQVVVTRVAPNGPGAKAGLQPGDRVIGVGPEPVGSMADFFRKIWDIGPAGSDIPVNVLRDGQPYSIVVASGDRYDYLKLKPSY